LNIFEKYIQTKCKKQIAIIKNILNKIAIPLLELPRSVKSFVVFLIDFLICVLTVWFSFFLRLGEFISLSDNIFWMVSILCNCIALPIFLVFGLYRNIFRHSGWASLLLMANAVFLYGLIIFLIYGVYGVEGVPRTIGIIQPLLFFLLAGASRALAQAWLSERFRSSKTDLALKKAVIYGAGYAGRQYSLALNNNPEIKVIGFLDDNDSLHGRTINNLPVFNPTDLSKLVSHLSIDVVLLAMPRLGHKRRNEILSKIQSTFVIVRILPNITNLIQGKISYADFREPEIDDLIGRDSVMPNQILMREKVHGKVVMVTGAGGSIGAELCRQILAFGPSKILLVDHSEYALYLIHQDLKNNWFGPDDTILPILASVQDEACMCRIISTWQPFSIYHTAAYKHVYLVEHNITEGLKNNVFGTLCIAQLAIKLGVANFVLISSDKAVRPTSIMGASKRMAEMILQALSAVNTNSTVFSIVRFGNVLGSSGSVVPKFSEQIKNGGPVTITHPEITRYFMTIQEAAQLVIQAGAMAKGGEIFVLDMGKPVKIKELAQRMIELSGLTVKDEDKPHGEIEIVYTGLQPGEKLYEELQIGNNQSSTEHPKIINANEDFIIWSDFQSIVDSLKKAIIHSDIDLVLALMKKIGIDYSANNLIVDFLYNERKA